MGFKLSDDCNICIASWNIDHKQSSEIVTVLYKWYGAETKWVSNFLLIVIYVLQAGHKQSSEPLVSLSKWDGAIFEHRTSIRAWDILINKVVNELARIGSNLSVEPILWNSCQNAWLIRSTINKHKIGFLSQKTRSKLRKLEYCHFDILVFKSNIMITAKVVKKSIWLNQHVNAQSLTKGA